MNDEAVEAGEEDPRRIGAILLSSFFPAAPPLEPTDVEDEVARVSVAWQRLSAFATLIEVAGVTAEQPHGRMAEIFGRLASSGEQLMLAGTCLRDARRWDSSSSSELAQSVASRGLAEMANYFALSAAHGLVNITLRLLLIDERARLVIDQRYRGAEGFPPFGTKEQAWVALNPRSARALVDAAADLAPVVAELAVLPTALVEDPRWEVLMRRRAVDFHQFRPQSVGGGASTANPWQIEPDGEARLQVGEFNGHTPPSAERLVAESNDALEALSLVMARWLDLFQPALKVLLDKP